MQVHRSCCLSVCVAFSASGRLDGRVSFGPNWYKFELLGQSFWNRQVMSQTLWTHFSSRRCYACAYYKQKHRSHLNVVRTSTHCAKLVKYACVSWHERAAGQKGWACPALWNAQTPTRILVIRNSDKSDKITLATLAGRWWKVICLPIYMQIFGLTELEYIFFWSQSFSFFSPCSHDKLFMLP